MKHLLIILISLLLLSSPVIGQETGVLYLYESSSGFVLKSFGDGKVQPKYKGEITNGKPDGFGVLTYPYGERSVVGEWKNGKEWNTKHTNKDGTILGKFENGEWIGNRGVLYLGWRNGEVGWYDEKWEGVENEDNKNFGKYEGEIKNGETNGQGTLTIHDGTKYEGGFKNGVPYGLVTKTYPSGSKYVGEWKGWERHGQGTLTWGKGNWEGQKYVGEWKDDERTGHGTYTLKDGSKYVGEWKNGEYNGLGTRTYPSGSKYVGEWKDGKEHGKGTFYHGKGQFKGGWYEGEYKDGKGWNGIFYDKDGNITYKYVNGEWMGP